ncbi:MAG: DoxX family protein [Pseudomonas sp.]|uniref:DoxX family protein n=1 Tax=Pseudomonas abieticivorans TaxID=2931382 RepID=UPI0020BED586|nr:DoxX family protein [Pseudomonas sp. PIA16]MDE1164887.1 DoxX family protein [Pseudomonas sp.]
MSPDNACHVDNTAQSVALLWLRLGASVLLLWVHGLPKLANYTRQLQLIEDPFHLGAAPTLCLAIFAEVLCPLLIIAGVFTRLACLPILAVLLIALIFVHPQWSVAEGQFAWLLLLLFTTILIAGPGPFALGIRLPGPLRFA